MGDVHVDIDGSGTWARTRVRVICSVRCIGQIGLWLELRFGSNVRVMARLGFMITMMWW